MGMKTVSDEPIASRYDCVYLYRAAGRGTDAT